MSEPLLQVDDLKVEFRVGADVVPAVRGASFTLHRGEVLALVGESGSGKSVSALSLVGLLPDTASVSGSARLDGDELIGMPESRMRHVRGDRIAVVFQDPTNALDPVFTIGFQIGEMLRRHRPSMSKAERQERTLELLRMVELPDPEQRIRSYPHQLSGGQAQRVMIAMALSCDPELLIADEPTTALDVTVQREVLDVMRRLQQRTGTSILLITHDMGVVADMADRVVVLRRGLVEETAEVQALFDAPQAAYTQELLAAVPQLGSPERPVPEASEPVLRVQDLVVEYKVRRGVVRAVDGVSLEIGEGEMLALVGESGSGKSTIGKSILGLAPLTEGSVTIGGLDLATASRRQVREVKRSIGVVFQNPTAALNPRATIGDSIGEPLHVHERMRGAALSSRVGELLERVELPASWAARYPHELSGGQRQRVAIARALALEPTLLIADEPTSALDVSVQATVLELLRELQRDLRFACLFVSHDLAVVDALCDRVAVLHRGRVVELGSRRRVLMAPEHEYTQRLLEAAPLPDPRAQRARRAA
ncbi:ABC transporter ATP-binding protein [Agrococcus jejuensis]|uniref:ABC transporter ATP-binding protein n=1 Tax=Agrococcus jejuensis TaxID=399736 RepID=UPI0011A608EB|nr:ABC transporter ATP-binding protein [Agrococcus jejuensis]